MAAQQPRQPLNLRDALCRIMDTDPLQYKTLVA